MAIVVGIEGMTCGGCVQAVRRALERAGVPAAEVEIGRARIDAPHEPEAVARVRAAIEKAGFVPGDVSSG